MAGDRPDPDLVTPRVDRSPAAGDRPPADRRLVADLRLGWWTLHDLDGVLHPDTFLTQGRALDRATLHPLWQPASWQIYDPDGRLALTRKTRS